MELKILFEQFYNHCVFFFSGLSTLINYSTVMSPSPYGIMDDLPPSTCFAEPSKSQTNINESNEPSPLLQSPSKPLKHSQSFYKRIRLSTVPKEETEPSQNDTSSGPIPDSSVFVEEFKSIQSLKQFWINAFASIRSSQKKGRPPKSTAASDQAESNRKCATLGSSTTRGRHNQTERSVTLNRNFGPIPNETTNDENEQLISKSQSNLNDNCRVDNFYKYKDADLVKRRYSRQSSGDQAAMINTIDTLSTNPAETPPTIETDIPAVTMHVTRNKLSAEKTKSLELGTSNDSDKIATEVISSASQMIKTNSSSSLATSNNDSVTSSKKSTGHHGIPRKCSFRTNLYQSNHRKMVLSSAPGGSKVAALTHRFNQLSQQDSDRIREEVRRNKHVIVHRVNGKVFKVMTEETASKKLPLVNRLSSESSPARLLQKKGSIKRKDRPPVATKSSPKTETANNVAQIKPKVPDKSPEVIMRTKVIAERNVVIKSNMTAINKSTLFRLSEGKELNAISKDYSDIISNGMLDKNPSCELLSSISTTGLSISRKKNNDEKLTETLNPLSMPTHSLSSDETEKSYKNISIDNKHLSAVCKSNETTSSQESTSSIDTKDLTIPNEIDEVPKKKKYVRLYEKFRFRPSFMSSNKKALLRISPDTSHVSHEPDSDLPHDDPASVIKIVEAISKASQRIELLSKSESCLLTTADDRSIQPNESFLFKSTTNTCYSDYHQHASGLVEAINPCVLGKSRSMDEALFAENVMGDGFKHECPAKIEEDDYEIISPPDEVHLTQIYKLDEDIIETQNPAKFSLETQPSFLYKSLAKKGNTMLEEPIVKSEVDCSDIYQSIAEVFNIKPTDQDSINSYESFENYECVDEKLLEQIKNENGYEICEPLDPPPEPPPPRHSCPNQAVNSPEPPLPVPKRNFQNFSIIKSDSLSSNYELIKYDKVPPRPPKSCPLPPEPIPPLNTSEEDTSSPDTEYDTENIYDTIKSAARRLPNQKQVYYDTIGRQPSFLRTKRLSKISMADSDSGSTLSSDNKTNSLYGSALSRRESVSPPSEPSDNNSDDWIDISDGEVDEAGHSNKLVV